MKHQVCTRCVIDSDVPGTFFDEYGICNYCKLHDILTDEWPIGQKGQEILDGLVEKMNTHGRGKRYDCIVGVSGGTDSTYLLYLTKKLGLRPLAVHFDNGWNSEIAVNNIHKALAKLDIDLQTYVVDWEEFKDILVSFLKASFPWADVPTDIGITSSLYRIAAQEGVKYVIVGNHFRTEGKMPTEWTYADGRLIRHIHKRFGKNKMKTFPNLNLFDFFYFSIIKRIRLVRILNYVDYRKDEARKLLEEELDWNYYGGHHYESIFTRFCYSYFLPEKFNIDKRKITHSALVRSGEMGRQRALEDIATLPYPADRVEDDIDYVIKKLGLTEDDFTEIMNLPPKDFRDFPSYYSLFQTLKPLVSLFLRIALPWKPPMLHEMEVREETPVR